MSWGRDALRAARSGAGAAVGAVVAACPWLEPGFIRLGRAAGRQSRLLSTLYWACEDDLVRRLRQSPRRFRQQAIAGVRVSLDVTDQTARLLYFHNEPYEPLVVDVLAAILKPGDAFLDVGANIGFFSLIAERLVGRDGRVVAFEPHPEARDRLRALMTANGISDQVEVVGAAVGAAARDAVPLFLSDDTILSTLDPGHSPARAHFSFPRSVDVPLVTLDDWLRSRPDVRERLRLVKIDVEGAEPAALEGMRETLRAARGLALVCETEPGGAGDRILRAEGYQAEPLDIRAVSGNYLYRRQGPLPSPSC